MRYRHTKSLVPFVLVASLLASGLALVGPPALSHGAGAAITATPTTTNPGGIVTVSGAGFAASETVVLAISGTESITASGVADGAGLLPATSMAIPYTATSSMTTLVATGMTSHVTASTTISVSGLTPSIAISPVNTRPGVTEVVSGTGFGPQEQVALALNGESLSSLPQAITTTNGTFRAAFVVPSTLLRGSNVVSALGTQSQVEALAPLTGTVPRTTQYYFAGVLNTAREHPYIDLTNLAHEPASVRLVFAFDSGHVYSRIVKVRPSTHVTIPVANLGFLPEGYFGLRLSADRFVVAQITTDRDGRDGDVMLGTAPDTQWYFAAGGTAGTVQERISVFNPDVRYAAHVRMRLVRGSGQRVTNVVVTVPPHINRVYYVNRLVSAAELSVIATADRPVVVARELSFGPGERGYTTRSGAHLATTTWLFSDGTTENGVHTFFSILNPGNTRARVTAVFYQGGRTLAIHTLYVHARSRVTLNLAAIVQGGGIASAMSSDVPVVIERSEYIGSLGQEMAGSVVLGRNGTATQWAFPGGHTEPGYDEVVDLFNPTRQTIAITGTAYQTTGQVMVRSFTIPPLSRLVIAVNPLHLTSQHGMVLVSSDYRGFIAEQGISTRDSRVQTNTQGYAQ